MKGAMNRNFGTRFIPACALAAMAVLTACSDKQDVAGGASGDMGIVAKDIAGEALKGPFVKGSAVTVQGIDCKTMKFSDEVFEGKVKSDKGDFAFDDVTLSSTCAVFEATGKYRSEITGKESAGEITLHALTDLKDRKNVNINLLTELEYERVMYLVTEKGKTFADAKEQAEKEVLAAFGIAGDFDNSEDLTIYESGDGNAALLAVSVLMQAETDVAGLGKRVEKFADSFAETGKWKDSDTKKAISEWAVEAMANGKLDSIRKNVEAWNDGDKVAAFEKFIEAYADGDSVVLSCSSFRSSSSTLVEDLSSSSAKETGSEYDAATNTLKDLRDGQVYKTVKIGNQVWMAENLNYKTDSSFCYNDSAEYCAKYGRLYTWTAAMDACPDGWRLPGETDFKSLVKVVGGEKDAGTKLKSTSGWSDKDGKSGNGTDAFGFSALPAGMGNVGIYSGEDYTTYFWGSTECGSEGVPETGDGCASAMYLDYDDVDVSLKSYAAKDLWLSVRCVKGEAVGASSSSTEPALSSAGEIEDLSSSSVESSSSVVHLDWSVPKEAYLNSNIAYGEMTDLRDGQMYKTVKIGNRIWMAQNLDYADSTITPGIVGQNWCYDDDPEKCKVAGRLYTWSAATEVCPDGWHLPTKAEWDTLISLSGRVLKSQVGWGEKNGVDAVGFSMIPAGLRDFSVPFFVEDGSLSLFWTASKKTDGGVYGLYVKDEENDMLEFDLEMGFSVRCVNDEIDGATDPIWSVLTKEIFFNPEIKYDSIVDGRDGQVYKTVKIGKQVWMAENLNYSDSVRTPSLLNRSWCFENDSANCKLAGRLYTWAAAIDSVELARNSTHPLDCGYKKQCGLDSAVQGICPEKWHLPTRAEWRTLFNEIGGDSLLNGSSGGAYLKSQVGWYAANYSDEYGFSAIPVGFRNVDGDFRYKWDNTLDNAWFWSATEASSVDAHYMRFLAGGSILMIDDTKFYGYSIRCVKD